MKPRQSKTKTLPRRTQLAICAGIIALIWIVFGQTLSHDFVNYDDKTYVYGNPQVTNGVTAQGLVFAFSDKHTGNWHPLTMISHMIDCQLFALKAGGHHFTNVLLHSIAALLLFFFLNNVTGRIWASGFVTTLFAIHPLRVESVAWIAERKDVLSAVFFFLTLIAYVRYARAPIPRLRDYLMMSILFACGLMSKPMLVTTPVILLLLDYWPRFAGANSTAGLRERKDANRSREAGGSVRETERTESRTSWTKLILEKIPLFALSLAIAVVTFMLQERATGSVPQLPFVWRVQNAIVSYVIYIGQIFWPAGLSVFYPHPENRLPLWQVLGSGALLVAITALAFALRRSRPYLLVGWLWYAIMLLPVSGIVEVGLQGHADRYTYLPHIGLYIAIIWAAVDLFRSSRIHRAVLPSAVGLAIVLFTVVAWKQTTFWRNGETLWTRTLAVTSDNDVAHVNYGMLLMERGQLDDALAHFETALQIRSSVSHPHYALNFALIHCDIGNALARKGQVDAAIDHLRTAIEFEPGYGDAHYNLGTAFFRKGEIDEAIAEWQKTLSIQPTDATTHTNLGNAFVQKGFLREAISHYRSALELEPDSVLALNNLAWTLATGPDRVRNGAEAVELAERANRDSETETPAFIRTLAAAYAEVGRFDDAIEAGERAARVARAGGQNPFANQIEEETNLYRQHMPMRDESLKNATR